MADRIVSVRMPATLLKELRELADRNHYLDVSEEIRSVLRERWSADQDPYATHLKEIRKKVTGINIPSQITALKKDLSRLLEELENVS